MGLKRLQLCRCLQAYDCSADQQGVEIIWKWSQNSRELHLMASADEASRISQIAAEAGVVIVVACRSEDRGAVVIEVSDNGERLPQGIYPNINRGLRFQPLRGLSLQLSARIEFDTDDHGMRIRVYLSPP